MDSALKYSTLSLVVLALSLGGFACGDDDSDSDGDSDSTGAACEAPEDCFQDIEVEGDRVCFTQVEDGYCSHTCETNDDCCTAEGECVEGLDYLCTGLESRSGKFCFIECSSDSGQGGDESICNEISTDFECRNTGRGVGSHACLPPGE